MFALADGSGVSLNHLSYSTVSPTTNTTGPVGATEVVTAPASFTTAYPDTYTSNWCSTTNLLLEGTSDTSMLATAVTAHSDGYAITSTIALDQLYAGALTAWRATCLVYYSS